MKQDPYALTTVRVAKAQRSGPWRTAAPRKRRQRDAELSPSYGRGAQPHAAAMAPLAELLDIRAKGLEIERNTPKPVPLRENRDYAKYFKWLAQDKFTRGEISNQLLNAGLDTKALEMDPDKPYGWQPGDDDYKRSEWAPPPVTARSQPGLKAVFEMFDGGTGSMDVKKLGGCLHKLGVKYDRPLFELASKAFDEDGSGLIEFGEFVEMFATLRASDELALGDFGAPSAELTPDELQDVKTQFDSIDADGSGAIDEAEVKILFKKLDFDVTHKEVRGMISFLDEDGSGEIELEEFNELMMCAKARRPCSNGALDCVGALKAMFEEQRKAAKVVRVAVGSALAALHANRVLVGEVGELASSTARCLVGHCGETKAVLQILSDACHQAQTAADSLAKTELMLACENGMVEQCLKALEKGADPNSRARDCDGNFGPTGAPALEEDTDIDPEVAEELKRQNGRTCLLVALENGHPGVALELLKAGADPALQDDADGLTPLMMAPKSLAVVKHSKLVDLLFGADVSVETPDGRNACSFAAAFGRDGYLRRLVASDCSPEACRPGVASPLILASQKDHGKCVQYLCDQKVDLDCVDHDGKSAAMHAQAGDLKNIREIIDKARVRAAQEEKDIKEGRTSAEGKTRRRSTKKSRSSRSRGPSLDGEVA